MGEEGDEEEYSDLLSPDDSILILTGANASGKSVFLKTVALIVYMVRRPVILSFIASLAKTLTHMRHRLTLDASFRLVKPSSA